MGNIKLHLSPKKCKAKDVQENKVQRFVSTCLLFGSGRNE